MFLNIPNYSKYLIDTETWGIYSKYKSALMKPSLSKKGHLHISLLSDSNIQVHFSIHRLIYTVVIGEIPKGYDIHHKDGNKLNNNPDNLIAIPHSEHLSLHKSGIKPSKETRKKMSVSAKKLNRTISPEQREKMIEGHRGKKHKKSVHIPQRKPICSIDKEGNIKIYEYLCQTAEDGFQPTNVCQCCQGTRKTHKGYQFRYLD